MKLLQACLAYANQCIFSASPTTTLHLWRESISDRSVFFCSFQPIGQQWNQMHQRSVITRSQRHGNPVRTLKQIKHSERWQIHQIDWKQVFLSTLQPSAIENSDKTPHVKSSWEIASLNWPKQVHRISFWVTVTSACYIRWHQFGWGMNLLKWRCHIYLYLKSVKAHCDSNHVFPQLVD